MKYAAWDKLPKGWTAESVKKLWKTLTKGHKRKITRCMERMDGKVSDPGAYCGSLASQVGYRKGKKAMIVPEEQPLIKNTRRRPLFSDSVRVQLRKVFGVKNLPFFMFYETVRNVLDGDPIPEEGLVNPLRNSVRLITQMATSEAVRVLINETVILIRPLLNRLEEGQEWDRTQILRFTENYANLMREICSGRGVFMTTMSSGDILWPAFRKMTDSEQNMEELRLSDPEAYGNALDAKNLIRTVDKNIEQTIRDMGLTVTRKELMGRPVNVGTDPNTGEEFVFDTDGDLMTVDQFITKRKSFLDSQKHLTKTFPKIDEVRKLTDADVDALMGDVEYVAMTDDKAKANALTRVYAVRRNDSGQMVVVEGRFKGCYMDDLVNVSGRMIEGVSYQLDPKTNLPVQIDLKNPDGSYKVKKVTEPYATVTSKGELMIRLSSSNNPLDTHLRGVMKKLSTMMPGIKYEASSRNSVFTFHPQDFAAIRNALGGLALSQSAVTTIKEFFADQAKHDLATSEDNLQYFSADKIGGFKPGIKLFKKQKEAMAWLESRGHAGVIALDTGVGKCVTGDTLVWTNQGLLPIRDINPGIVSPDTAQVVDGWSVILEGEHLPIRSFYYGGEKNTIKATLASGISVEGSFVHPIAVRGQEGEGWVRLPDLRIGDAVCVDRTEQNFSAEEPELSVPDPDHFTHSTNIYDVPRRMTPDLARLLGYIVGEAHTRNRTGFCITQHYDVNPEPHDDIRSTMLSVFGWDHDKNNRNHNTSISVSSVYLRDFLEKLGIEYVCAANKKVPDVIFRSTKQSVREFLRALFEGEASVDDGGTVEISSASERLLREVQILLLGFGIVGRRSPKYVKGYEHTYWRMALTGEEARQFHTKIGFISRRKQRAALVHKSNPNMDVIPFVQPLVERVRSEIASVAAGIGKGGGIVNRWGHSFFNSLQHIRWGRRAATYPFLRKLLAVAEEVGVATSLACEELKAIINRHLLYDPIVKLEVGRAHVMDIEVNDPRHCFVGNGIVNHNTLIQVASMQKAIRDGFLEPGQKFLCVCPAALKNNLPKQAIEMLDDAQALIDRMDILTYQEFAKKVKADPNFASQYAAVYFDEAQALKNPTSGASKAASALKHPRKILLTASPMEKSPMEVLTLVAITNGMDLNTKQGRAYLKAFRERFCEEVGGKIIGIKNDPQTAKDFRIWVKQSLYFADKRDVEEIALPVLRTTTTALTMDPEVEAKYREVVQRNLKIFQGMVSKYRDRNTKMDDPKIESARMKLAKEFKLLFELANMPWKHVPGARSPKMDHAVSLIDERVSSGRRTILFTDNPELASYTAKDMSNQFPGKLHAECGASTIILWKNGKETARYGAKAYQDGDRVWPKSNWKGYVLDRVIQADPNCLTCVLTSSYAVGQNLQAFDTVIHLDRDAWNNETMKQRTARAWRTGQDHPVDEVVLDAVFSEPDGALDATADEIAKYMQQIESDIFQRVVVESQTEALGKDWFDMKKMKSSMTQLSRRVMLLAQSPYAKNLGLVGVPGSEGVAS